MRSDGGMSRRPRSRPARVRFWYARTCLLVVLVAGLVDFDLYSGSPGTSARDCSVQLRPALVVGAPTSLVYAGLSQVGGTVNDVTCLNQTEVYGVVRVASVDDVAGALAFARDNELTVSIAGTQHSMGGQASHPGALVLDMRGLDRVVVDAARRTIRVGAGARWSTVLEAAHPHGLSVAAMPGIDVLSVGGTVSVNAHGADFRTGSLASTVRSLLVMTADGEVRRVSRSWSPELFRAAIGGYGMYGVILEVELEAVDDEMYDFGETTVPTAGLAAHLDRTVVPDQANRMMYAHLSTSPSGFLEEAIVYTFRRLDAPESIPPLRPHGDSRVARLVFNLARHGGVFQRMKWSAQTSLLPRFRGCGEAANASTRASGACLISRNQAFHNDLGLLKHKLGRFTNVLQEYFVPADRLAGFVAAAAPLISARDAELMNASVRSVHRGEVLWDYAPTPRLSLVLDFSQRVTPAGNRDLQLLTEQLIALALEHGGTFYLPYQQHYTPEQLRAAYPMADAAFAYKREVDPGLLLMNSLYARYAGT